MPDYKAMYLHLFNAVTDAVEALQKAQKETEAMYVDADGEAPVLLVGEDAPAQTDDTDRPENKTV